MKRDSRSGQLKPAGRRVFRRLGAILVMLPLVCTASGCGDQAMDEFRAAAVSSIEAGVNYIADGLISGIFALATPDSSSSGSDGGETAG
jgi:hypothetical protein